MLDNLFRKRVGNTGEELAVKFLRLHGYRILERNFLIRGGEIDIIAQEKDLLVFVEVKARYSHEFGTPAESITYFKMKALLKTAAFYLQKIKWGDKPYRIDLVTIDYTEDKHHPQIAFIKNISC